MSVLPPGLAFQDWVVPHSWARPRDARAKLCWLLAMLLALALIPRVSPSATTVAMGASPTLFFLPLPLLLLALLLFASSFAARLRPQDLFRRLLRLTPFPLGFALAQWLSGTAPGELPSLVARMLLSALALIIFLSCTRLEELFSALRRWHLPKEFVVVLQQILRYGLLVAHQGHRMRLAAALRAPGTRLAWLQLGSGALALLFLTTYERGGRIHRAMLARGFQGEFPLLSQPVWQPQDWLLASFSLLVPLAMALLLPQAGQL